MLLVDDLPHAAQPEQRQRLAAALTELLSSARFPTVVTATEVTGRGADRQRDTNKCTDLHPVRRTVRPSITNRCQHFCLGFVMPMGFVRCWQEIERAIDAAGTRHISLNTVTTAAMVKRISAVAAAEQVPLSPAEVRQLAELAGGDLRNALETLQLLCGGSAMKTALHAKKVRCLVAAVSNEADA